MNTEKILVPITDGTELTVYKIKSLEETPINIYIQAGTHSDELSAIKLCEDLITCIQLNLNHLQKISFTIVPNANPLGFKQRILTTHIGRYNLSNGENFNRNFPTINKEEIEKYGIVNDIKKTLSLLHINKYSLTQDPYLKLKHALLSLSSTADYIIDLHADEIAYPHIYCNKKFLNFANRIVQNFGFPVIIEKNTSLMCFDEANHLPYPEINNNVITFEVGSKNIYLNNFIKDIQYGILLFLTELNEENDYLHDKLFSIDQLFTKKSDFNGLVNPSVIDNVNEFKFYNKGEIMFTLTNGDKEIKIPAEHSGYLLQVRECSSVVKGENLYKMLCKKKLNYDKNHPIIGL